MVNNDNNNNERNHSNDCQNEGQKNAHIEKLKADGQAYSNLRSLMVA